ncbi:MAG TPA: hypothetical protein VHE83_03765 [Mycobacteriales bacterium]|nr:hypothetical protein [Mycobacteriales bacterium]
MTEQEPEVLSSEPEAPASSRRRRTIVAGIALVGVGALAGGIAASATGAGATARQQPFASSPTPLPGDKGGPMRGPGPAFGPRGGPLGVLGGDVLHGSAVVKGRDGTTKTVEVQNGTVTAVADKALTVKSSDGFSQSYTVIATTRVMKDWEGSTASAIKMGDTVEVLAEVVDGAHQATLIADGQGGFKGGPGGLKHFRGGPGGGPRGIPAPPTPAPTPNA